MNMPPSSPSMSSPGPNAQGSTPSGMSPMNAPSQSPQPSMSPSPQFNQSIHGQMQSQSPHSIQQSSPRMQGQDDGQFNPNAVQRPLAPGVAGGNIANSPRLGSPQPMGGHQ